MHERSLGDTTELVLDILLRDPLGSARRQAFVDLSAEDREVLRALHSILVTLWPPVVDALLDHARHLPELRAHFDDESSTAPLRASLVAHALELSSGDYGDTWLADRIRIGLSTAENGFPTDWFISAWSFCLSRAIPDLEAALRDSPVAGLTLETAVRAVLKVAFLDIGMTLHARAYVESTTLDGSRRFAEAVWEAVPDGIVMLDDTGRVVSSNRAAREVFGLTREELEGREFGQRLHEAHRAEEETLRGRLFQRLSWQGGEPPGPRAGPTALAMTGLRADGSAIPLEVSFQAGLRDGEPTCCVSLRDVSERVRAEQALRRSEANFRALIEGSPDAVLVHRGGQIVYANPGLLRILALPDLRAVLGRNVTELVVPGDRRALLTARAAALPRGGPGGPGPSFEDLEDAPHREIRFLRSDGTELVTETREFALDFDARPAIVLVARDVTERHRLAARMLEMDRAIAIGNVVAATSHEINNPLTYVLGNTQFVRTEATRLAARLRGAEPPSPEELATRLDEMGRALDECQEGAMRVRETVASLRSLVRQDDPQGALVSLPAVIDHAVSITVNEIRHRARLERQYLAVPGVKGSERRLCQVFVHLLLNAAQSIPEGAIEANEIRISTCSVGDRVAISVSDTGGGMPADVKLRAFEPFFTTHPTGEALGLGLTISRQIIEACGGTLTLESEPGVGTTVRISLPAVGEVAEEARITRPISHDTVPGRILLIDDEPSVASAFRRVVDDRHAVTSLTSARDALRRLRAGETWDLVFSDLHMPDMSGMALHDILASEFPEVAAHMVFLTGGAFTPEARAFLRRVANPCLDKPFDAARIRQIVAHALTDAPSNS